MGGGEGEREGREGGRDEGREVGGGEGEREGREGGRDEGREWGKGGEGERGSRGGKGARAGASGWFMLLLFSAPGLAEQVEEAEASLARAREELAQLQVHPVTIVTPELPQKLQLPLVTTATPVTIAILVTIATQQCT